VTYRNLPVDALASSTVVIWNAGTTTLEGSAIITNDRLRLELGAKAKVLSAELVKVSREVIKFSAVASPEREDLVLLGFEFLDPGDGAVVRVLHTGIKLHAAVRGTIKGMPSGCINAGTMEPAERVGTTRSRNTRIFRTFMLILTCGMGTMVIASGLSPRAWDIVNWPLSRPKEGSVTWLAVVMGMVYILLPSALLYTLRRRYPKSLMIEDPPSQPTD
jgi:hypothetical protein